MWKIYSQLILESKIILRESSVKLTLVLLTISCMFAFYNGKTWLQVHKRSAEQATEKQQRELSEGFTSVSTFEKNYISTGRYLDISKSEYKNVKGLSAAGWAIGGWTVTIPTPTIALLFIGQGDAYPESVKVSLWNRRFDLFRQVENTNPLVMLNGRFDVAFLVIYIYPLIILGLTYNIISREREHCTLTLIASFPIHPQRVYIIRSIFLLVLLLLPLIAVFLAFAFIESIKEWHLFLWIITAICYETFWLALAIAINSRPTSSNLNALILMSIWVILMMLIPQLSNLIISAKSPAPSPARYILALRDARNVSEINSSKLRNYYLNENPQLKLEPNLSIYSYWLEGWYAQKLMNPIIDEYESSSYRKFEFADRFRFFSPSMMVSDSLSELSGTSNWKYLQFRKAVTNYHSQWHDFFAPRMFTGRRMTANDYKNFPQFKIYEDNRPFKKAAITISMLLFMTMLLFVFAWKQFRIL